MFQLINCFKLLAYNYACIIMRLHFRSCKMEILHTFFKHCFNLQSTKTLLFKSVVLLGVGLGGGVCFKESAFLSIAFQVMIIMTMTGKVRSTVQVETLPSAITEFCKSVSKECQTSCYRDAKH